jgi:hypothetical protein
VYIQPMQSYGDIWGEWRRPSEQVNERAVELSTYLSYAREERYEMDSESPDPRLVRGKKNRFSWA